MSWAPDYVTAAEAKAYLRFDDTQDDVQLSMWITAASRAVDQFCGRQFGQVDSLEERTYPSAYSSSACGWVAQVDDVQDVTGLAIVDSDGETVTDFSLTPLNATALGVPYVRLVTSTCKDLTVTALWGWTAVPQAVKAATLLQTARLSARRDSPFGIAGSPAEQGEIRLLAQLDPDLRTSLRPYVRKAWRVG